MAACDGDNFRCATCDNNTNFGFYFSEDESSASQGTHGGCLGVHCKECWKEWLLPEYLPDSYDSYCTCAGILYVSPVREKPTESKLLQVTPSREEININNVEGRLNPADHIMWHREYVIWHHAIVEAVSGHMVTLIHFSKEKNDKQTETVIHRSEVDVRNENGKLYLIAYDDNILQYNPAELVLARARSLIGTTGYQLLSRNCENFATFCKTGVNVNQQREWFKQKLKELAQSVTMAFVTKLITPSLEALVAEGMELVLEDGLTLLAASAEAIGAGLIIAFEGGLCIWNLSKLHEEYSKPSASKGKTSLSRKNFIEEMVTEISRRFLGAGLGVGLGLGLTAIGTLICPGLGTVGGAILGIIGGCIGMVIGHAVGVPAGQWIGRVIAATVKANDRAVSLADLKPGDHIVMFGSRLHPRCHAIVVSVVNENQIKIIRHSYKRGVVMDVKTFAEGVYVYRVSYPDPKSTYSADEIVQRAVKALAEYKTPYNILLNNCKHFVYSIIENDELIKCSDCVQLLNSYKFTL